MLINKKILKLLIDTASMDESRSALKHIYFEVVSENEFNLVSTDGRCLFVVNQQYCEHGISKSFLIDKNMLKLLVKHKDWVADKSDYLLNFKILKECAEFKTDSDYPNYIKVIPKESSVLFFEFTNETGHIKIYKNVNLNLSIITELAALQKSLKFYSRHEDGYHPIVAEFEEAPNRSQKWKFVFMPLRKERR